MGKTYVGNSDLSAKPKKIYAGNDSNLSVPVKVAYVGDSNGKSVEVYRTSELPSAYQKVEYIYNTNGTEYIDTGVKPNSDTQISLELTLTTFPSGYLTKRAIFGIYASQSIRYSLNASLSYNTFTVFFNNSQEKEIARNLVADTRYKVDFNKNGGGFYVDGVLGYSSTSTFSTINRNLLLFGQYIYDSGNTPAVSFIKMHHFQVLQSGTMIRDMYPCYLKSDSQTVGMYDLINDQFYGNSGTGIFYKGPDV